MIIIDGPDGAGKTTLCAKLKEDGVVDLVLPSPRLALKKHDALFGGCFDYLGEYGGNSRVAVDRLFFSELIYGPIMRGAICFSANDFLELMDLIIYQDYNPIIFCLPRTLNFKSNESPEVVAKAYELYKGYEFLHLILSSLKNPKLLSFRYNWQEKDCYFKLLEFLKT